MWADVPVLDDVAAGVPARGADALAAAVRDSVLALLPEADGAADNDCVAVIDLAALRVVVADREGGGVNVGVPVAIAEADADADGDSDGDDDAVAVLDVVAVAVHEPDMDTDGVAAAVLVPVAEGVRAEVTVAVTVADTNCDALGVADGVGVADGPNVGTAYVCTAADVSTAVPTTSLYEFSRSTTAPASHASVACEEGRYRFHTMTVVTLYAAPRSCGSAGNTGWRGPRAQPAPMLAEEVRRRPLCARRTPPRRVVSRAAPPLCTHAPPPTTRPSSCWSTSCRPMRCRPCR